MQLRSVLSALGCASALACAHATPPATSAPEPVAAAPRAPVQQGTDPRSFVEVQAPRAVGERLVQRFSGAALPSPILLTEEVVELRGDQVRVRYSLERKGETEVLYAWRSVESDAVVQVEREVDGAVAPAPRDALDELLGVTSFTPDRNEGLVTREEQTCVVAGAETHCQTDRFAVRIDGAPATLTITRADAVPGRDAGGELRDARGKLLFRAEVVEVTAGGVSDAGVASRE